MVTKTVRVLHILDSLGTGGAEMWIKALIKYNSNLRQPNQIDVLLTSGEYKEEYRVLESSFTNVLTVKYSLKRLPSFSKKFKKILAAGEYDAIHDHGDFISTWHFLAGLGKLPPIRVAHVHNSLNFVVNYCSSSARKITYWLGRNLLPTFTTYITGTSNAVMDEYGYGQWPFKLKRINPLYCGFDVNQFRFMDHKRALKRNDLNLLANENVLLFIGRIDINILGNRNVNEKNPDFAVTIAIEWCKMNSMNKVFFVGKKGEGAVRLEKKAETHGLSNQIQFLGLRQDVADLMMASDLLLFPSFWEGLGMVAVEAQAAGLPVLMSDSIPDEAVIIPELVTRKSLVDPVETWVNRVSEMLKHKQADRDTYADRVAQSPFSIENSYNNLIRAYTQP